MTKMQWLIPTLTIAEPSWKATQAPDDRDEQLRKAAEQRQRRVERNLKLLSKPAPLWPR